MKTFSFCAFLSEGRWSNFEVLRICLSIAINLILGRRSGMVVVKPGQLWWAETLCLSWRVPTQPTVKKCLAPRTQWLGTSFTLSLASGAVNWFLCCLGFEPFFFQLGLSSPGEKAVTTRKKPYYFSFSCQESSQCLATVIFWLSLTLTFASCSSLPLGRLAFRAGHSWCVIGEVGCPFGRGHIVLADWRRPLQIWWGGFLCPLGSFWPQAHL